jgi:predicted Zn-dependent peptidase
MRLLETYEARPGTTIERYVLDNGLVLLLLVDPQAPVFSYQTWFRVGSRHERPGKTGIAHLFEHLMFKETKNTPEGQFDRILEGIGRATTPRRGSTGRSTTRTSPPGTSRRSCGSRPTAWNT